MDNITLWRYVQIYFRDYQPCIPGKKVKYDETFNPSDCEPICPCTKVSIMKEDILQCALKYHNPMVLILADAHEPGGCVGAGAGMQEESLFRRSALHKHLLKSLYPIEDDAAIYAPNVELLDGGNISFIACPGIKLPAIENNRFLPNDEERLRKKIRLIFQTAHKHGHQTLVLGALGCGVWGCPTRHVAEVFRDVIKEYDSIFTEVVFAILGANYNMFVDIFEQAH
jgi:uncharacterized protein (TIGR02452 family)